MTEPRDDRYDAVVIGSGFGGLSVAALLARAGLSVLVCERQEALGGYGHTLDYPPYRFDPAVRVTHQGMPNGLYDAVLRHLGTRDQVEFASLDEMYHVALPDGRTLRVPADLDGLIEAHAALFPAARRGFEGFFGMMATMHHQGHAMPMTLGLRNLDAVSARFPEYFGHLRRTLGDVAHEHLADHPEAYSAVTAPWPYGGVAPSNLGFIGMAQITMNAAEGTYYVLGGFQSLVDALAAGLTAHGGEIVTTNGARRIMVEDGRATGVVLDSGHEVRADHVISNADARQTILELVGEEHLPAGFVRRLQRMTLSPSCFVALVGTDLDVAALGLGHEVFVPTGWDHERDAAGIAAGVPAGVWIGASSIVDPSLAPAGEHAITVSAMAAYDIGRPWSEVRDAYCEQLLAIAERAIPGLRDHVTFLRTATPLTLERFTSNSGGAAYGWENTPLQSGTRRMPHTTPIRGLHLSGHWTMPGWGSFRCFASGVHTAAMVLRELGAGPPIPPESARAANLPEID